MTTIDRAAGNGSADYEAAKAKLQQMQEAEQPHGFLEHVLPHSSDNGMMRALKVIGGAAVGFGAIGGMLAGVGSLTKSAGLGRASGAPLTIAGAAVGLLMLGAIAGPMTGHVPGYSYSQDVERQREQVDAAWEQTPDAARENARPPYGSESPAEVAPDVMRAYDHDKDGSIDLHGHQEMRHDERVSMEYDPVKDADTAISTAYSTLVKIDTNHDRSVSTDEMATYVADTFDADHSGRISYDESRRAYLPEEAYDDYRDFALMDR